MQLDIKISNMTLLNSVSVHTNLILEMLPDCLLANIVVSYNNRIRIHGSVKTKRNEDGVVYEQEKNQYLFNLDIETETWVWEMWINFVQSVCDKENWSGGWN